MSPSPQPRPVSPSPNSHRKFPPPCWTHEESVALIEVYRLKWLTLRRTNLRSNDWESVAADVARRCPLVPSSKSSVQCRHKMDKLRKRYREEKQRALAHPDRFFTSWVLFRLMDSLENNRSSFSALYDTRHRPSGITGIKRKASDHGPGTVPSPKIRARAELYGKAASLEFGSEHPEITDEGCNEQSFSLLCGFPVSTFGDRVSPRPCPVSKVSVKVESSGAKVEEFLLPAKHLSNAGRDFMSGKFNLNNHCHFDGSTYSGRSEFKKRRSNIKSERSKDSVANVFWSINTVGQELLKLENMKMEMAQEIEKRRMKMEMKHTEMTLQLQVQIVDLFAKALFEREK